MSQDPSETPLRRMTRTTPTALWNDSCALAELSASIERNGAVGATCNPVIVLEVLKKEWPFKGDEPAWPQSEFEGKLWSPGLFKKAIYKYTVSIDGKVAADPIIIIER